MAVVDHVRQVEWYDQPTIATDRSADRSRHRRSSHRRELPGTGARNRPRHRQEPRTCACAGCKPIPSADRTARTRRTRKQISKAAFETAAEIRDLLAARRVADRNSHRRQHRDLGRRSRPSRRHRAAVRLLRHDGPGLPPHRHRLRASHDDSRDRGQRQSRRLRHRRRGIQSVLDRPPLRSRTRRTPQAKYRWGGDEFGLSRHQTGAGRSRRIHRAALRSHRQSLRPHLRLPRRNASKPSGL